MELQEDAAADGGGEGWEGGVWDKIKQQLQRTDDPAICVCVCV